MYAQKQSIDDIASSVRSAGGFTLVELMMTLAVAAILTTVAIPGFSTLIRDNRLVAGTNQLVTALAVARSEAVKRGSSVSICASDDGTSCTGTNWNQGWVVFSDSGTAGSVDGTDTVLRVQGAVNTDLSITVSSTSGNNYASFRSTGFLASGDANPLPIAALLARSTLARFVSAVMPGAPAYAGNGNGASGGSTPTTTTTTDAAGAPVGAATQFTICDGRNGETGRRISLWASGRVETDSVTCSN